MREVTVNKLGGILNQLYSYEQSINTAQLTSTDECPALDINSMFWSKMLSEKHVRGLVEMLMRLKTPSSTKLSAVLNNPELFIRKFLDSKELLKQIRGQSQKLFALLETLQLACELHTILLSGPFKLTIFNGYEHHQDSAKILDQHCCLPYCNPYFGFIQEDVLPKLYEISPDLVWMLGRPNIASFCIAKKLKQYNSNVFVVIADQASEFYSLSKISDLLSQNYTFFSVFDCIVFDNQSNCFEDIRQTFKTPHKLETVKNLIFTPDRGKTIYTTPRKQSPLITIEAVTHARPQNIRLFPYNHCYWRHCSFCGINNKYSERNDRWELDNAITQLSHLRNYGVSLFWANDEAIPPSALSEVADWMQAEKTTFSWHVRTRIDKNLLENDLPAKLAKSGLCSILLGFESASARILRLMKKNEINESHRYLELTESIVKSFCDLKVSVHLTVLIGYPTELPEEREDTYSFLRYLRSAYPMLSYNINILDIDVTSDLFTHWSRYNIGELKYSCSPDEFLGNHVTWNTYDHEYNRSILEVERRNEMLNFYQWYPSDALIDVSVFYAMWEYSRNQLFVQGIDASQGLSIDYGKAYALNPDVVAFRHKDNVMILYNFENHQCICGGPMVENVIRSLKEGVETVDIIKNYGEPIATKIREFFNDLCRYRFIFPVTKGMK
jgi:hypothetical protein